MSIFHFKYFSIHQSNSALKVGTDAMILGSSVESENVVSILDIGSGTGVLSLMMAQKYSEAKITAIEVDEESVKDCAKNFENSLWFKNLTLIEGDFLSTLFENKFDLIVTNPPFYLDSLTNEDLKKAKAKHSVHLPFDELIQKISQLLNPKGLCWLIIPIAAKKHVSDLISNQGLFVNTIISIQAKPNLVKRVILSFGINEKMTIEKTLLIRNEDGNYSNQYIELTKEFHSIDLSQKA